MRSVADSLRTEVLARSRNATAAQRIRLALELGRADLETYRAARGLDPSVAELELRRRQRGRQPSACMDALLR